MPIKYVDKVLGRHNKPAQNAQSDTILSGECKGGVLLEENLPFTSSIHAFNLPLIWT